MLEFLIGALEKVVLDVQCLLGQGRAVQVVLRAVVDWKRRDVEDQEGDDMADVMKDSFMRTKAIQRIPCPGVLVNRPFCTSCTLWVCILCTWSALQKKGCGHVHPC